MMALLDTARPYGHRSAWSAARMGLSRFNFRDLDRSQDAVNPPSELASESDAVPRPGDLVGGKFRITETLGQGGMGIVLGGEHLDLRQLVAIKVLRPALAKEPDALARFLREARAAASIKSRHAVRIYDVGTSEAGVPYMVMERLHGVGVEALLEKQGALPVEQAVQIVVEAAEAIAEAHGLGIIHRDVKPSNLFLSSDASGAPIVKVLDFGISKRVTVDDGHESASLTAPQTLLGSPQYMSPEQLRDPRSVDERTDVWGLGVTLYELLTGRVPFECDSIPELCALIFNSTPARADTVRPEIPSSLADVIVDCLTKRAEARIQSVPALVARLVPFCHGDMQAIAEQLARTMPASSADAVRLRGGAAAPSRSRRGAQIVGTTAVTVALGVALYFRAHFDGTTAPRSGAPAASDPAPSGAAQASAADTGAAPSAIPALAASAVEDAAIPVPPAATGAARPPPAASLVPPGPSRPRGLKGIKLMD